jgi:hypothetical protein
VHPSRAFCTLSPKTDHLVLLVKGLGEITNGRLSQKRWDRRRPWPSCPSWMPSTKSKCGFARGVSQTKYGGGISVRRYRTPNSHVQSRVGVGGECKYSQSQQQQQHGWRHHPRIAMATTITAEHAPREFVRRCSKKNRFFTTKCVSTVCCNDSWLLIRMYIGESDASQ